MTTQDHRPARRRAPATCGGRPHRTSRTAEPAAVRHFRVPLTSTPRGARLARLLTVAHLCSWDLPTESAGHIVAELATNAVTHGGSGDFQLGLSVTVHSTHSVLRIEVSDARPELLPAAPRTGPAPGAEGGRGLVIVDALADRWGTVAGAGRYKTVWAELRVRC